MELNEMLGIQALAVPNTHLQQYLTPRVQTHAILIGMPEIVAFGAGYGMQILLEHIAIHGIPTDLEEIMHGEKV